MLSRILSSAVVEGKDGEGKGVEDEPKGRVVCGGGAGGRCRGGAANARRRKGEGGELGAPRLSPGGLRFRGGRGRRTQAESEFEVSFLPA